VLGQGESFKVFGELDVSASAFELPLSPIEDGAFRAFQAGVNQQRPVSIQWVTDRELLWPETERFPRMETLPAPSMVKTGLPPGRESSS
jgi:hypothetical protein